MSASLGMQTAAFVGVGSRIEAVIQSGPHVLIQDGAGTTHDLAIYLDDADTAHELANACYAVAVALRGACTK